MDALASLAFGIIVVQVIRDLGVDDPTAVAGSTVRAGIFSSLLMAFIYIAVTIAGTQSRGVLEASENGGTALAQIAQHYLGSAGLFILAATVTLACLKTAVGLITSCAETFSALFPDGPKYRIWAIIFSLVSLLFANLGLSAIISYSLPVLMFLYPLSIALIALALLGRLHAHRCRLRSDHRAARERVQRHPRSGHQGVRSAVPTVCRPWPRLDLPDAYRRGHRPYSALHAREQGQGVNPLQVKNPSGR